MLLFAVLVFVFGAVIYKSCNEYRSGFIKLITIMSYKEDQSDDEIFFGKLSLKEFKKHIQWNGHSTVGENRVIHKLKTDPDTSVKIIETHSEPNLRAFKEEKMNYLSEPGSPMVNVKSPQDESFQIETVVSDLCVSPSTSGNVELNNTFEVIEYILKNGPKHDKEPDNDVKLTLNEEDDASKNNHQVNESPDIVQQTLEKSPQKEILQSKEHIMLETSPKKETIETNNKVKSEIKESIKYFTPLKMPKNPEIFVTPSSSSVKKTPIFKTPVPLSNRKPGWSAKKSPGRSNAYQHIASPIASYIKNCPQVPLVKDVHPKKPLPGCSSIPKLKPTGQQPTKSQNKENMTLPEVAYKSAKKTKVINIENKRMPQSQWAKKITSTLPRPTVMKHENREMNPIKKTLLHKQEDSFANLSCLQAEVSLCTQKTAFKKN